MIRGKTCGTTEKGKIGKGGTEKVKVGRFCLDLYYSNIKHLSKFAPFQKKIQVVFK